MANLQTPTQRVDRIVYSVREPIRVYPYRPVVICGSIYLYIRESTEIET